MPVHCPIGRHNIGAPTALAEGCFEVPKVLHKEIAWFGHAGHAPRVSEPDASVRAMVDVVPAQTQAP